MLRFLNVVPIVNMEVNKRGSVLWLNSTLGLEGGHSLSSFWILTLLKHLENIFLRLILFDKTTGMLLLMDLVLCQAPGYV